MSFESLPVELISRIGSHLQLQDWRALRLSCHILYERSLISFAETYFKKIHFMVINESLHELEELSMATRLRHHVQELWTIPSVFEGAEQYKGAVAISSKSCRQVKGDELETRHTIHKSMFADHCNLLHSETSDFSMRLQRCLDRFQNLKTIGLAHYKTTFLLDPRQQKVRFLGRHKLLSRIDFRFDIFSLRSLRRTDDDSPIRRTNALALSKFFLALSSSSCKPRKLYTCNSDLCGDIDPTINLTEVQYKSLLSTLTDLEDIHLCIDLKATAWMRLLTNVAPHLTKLTLSQDHLPLHQVQSYNDQVFRGMNFGRLREIHLHEIQFMFNGLRFLLISVKNSLSVLTLKKVRILSDESSPQQIDDWVGLSPLTNPSRQPGSISPEYIPLSPSFRPESPTFVPSSPVYNPSPPDHTMPASPLFRPARPVSELGSLDGISASPQHSPEFESSESSTTGFLLDNDRSKYHPWTPTSFFAAAVDPVDTPSIGPVRTCVTRLLDLLQKELSLNRLSMDNVVCDGKDYFCEPTTKVHFDVHTVSAGTPFSHWISRLVPEWGFPSPSSSVEDKEMEEWFDGMVVKNSGSLQRLKCDCKRKLSWGCPFGCDR